MCPLIISTKSLSCDSCQCQANAEYTRFKIVTCLLFKQKCSHKGSVASPTLFVCLVNSCLDINLSMRAIFYGNIISRATCKL